MTLDDFGYSLVYDTETGFYSLLDSAGAVVNPVIAPGAEFNIMIPLGHKTLEECSLDSRVRVYKFLAPADVPTE